MSCFGLGSSEFSQIYLGTAFTVETDHQPLSYLNKAISSNPRLLWLALTLQPYRFHIVAIH